MLKQLAVGDSWEPGHDPWFRWCLGDTRKKSECSFAGVEPTTFQWLHRILYDSTIGDSCEIARSTRFRWKLSVDDSGILGKIRLLLCRSRTYDLPITTSDSLPLGYSRLVEDRPFNCYTALAQIVETRGLWLGAYNFIVFQLLNGVFTDRVNFRSIFLRNQTVPANHKS